MILDFLKFLNEGKAKYAFVATYEFDPLFFERRMQPSRSFDAADRIVVFMDEGRYHELLTQGRQGEHFDRRYFVVPVRCDQGVFHPKLYFAIGDKACIASVGSNNCTASGTGHNFELLSAFKAVLAGDAPSPREALCASVFQLFRRIALDVGPMASLLRNEVFGPLEYSFPWLSDAQAAADPDGIELLSNFDASLWKQILDRLGTADVGKVTLCAPFFDESLSTIERIKDRWPNAKIEIIAQPHYSNLPSARLASLQDRFADIQLLSATPQSAGRNLHAKALAFETENETYWLTGSANISNAALVGGNREAGLWFSTRQRASEVLQHEDLTLAVIAATEFKEKEIAEPLPSSQPRHGLQILSAMLSDKGELRGTIRVPPSASDLSLRLFRLREQHPFLIRSLGGSKDDFVINLDDDQRKSFERPVIAYLQADIAGETVISNPASVAQLAQLLRDREGSGGAGNRLNRIAETGEGMIEYADALQGVDETIDFFKNVNIRFDDGSHHGGYGGQNWRARDPFSGDIPDSWLIGSRGGSITELRDAIWDFVERHISTRLQRHVSRGNPNGLPNFMDVYRTVSGLLLTYHQRKLEGETVIPSPYATSGLQQALAALIGPMASDDPNERGFVQAIQMNLGTEHEFVRELLERHRVAATVFATVDELIRVRSAALNCSPTDKWSMTRRKWVSDWIAETGLTLPSEGDLEEVGAEFRMAA
ncbi:phospholipase D-like domain-containing protein [Novosphingobium malaysiense]|uniref:Phospholipase D-like domain-containing protein n=1 Tax=Novosphingobium malaysiense TaxID=1348853 RepID=A0A0B1ZWN0_9SPHN|nr:phospholipase D-like domain-containing protein [Novosphingobium malaysiense]KHK93562.1 hypothetical protein LK12_04780 [Novosphingobium malaysiense]